MQLKLKPLSEQTIVITGATSGIDSYDCGRGRRCARGVAQFESKLVDKIECKLSQFQYWLS